INPKPDVIIGSNFPTLGELNQIVKGDRAKFAAKGLVKPSLISTGVHDRSRSRNGLFRNATGDGPPLAPRPVQPFTNLVRLSNSSGMNQILKFLKGHGAELFSEDLVIPFISHMGSSSRRFSRLRHPPHP